MKNTSFVEKRKNVIYSKLANSPFKQSIKKYILVNIGNGFPICGERIQLGPNQDRHNEIKYLH